MKNFIITGCAGGIGAACVEIFLKNGFAVTGMDIVDKEKVNVNRAIHFEFASECFQAYYTPHLPHILS